MFPPADNLSGEKGKEFTFDVEVKDRLKYLEQLFASQHFLCQFLDEKKYQIKIS